MFQEWKKNNRKDNFEQYLLVKLAALLQECCRCLKLWHRLPSRPSYRAVLVFTWSTSKLCFRDVNLPVFRIKQRTLPLKISLFTFSNMSSTLPQNGFKNVCNKAGSCIASALMSGDVLAMKQYITFI